MAQFGAKRPVFAPVTDTPKKALPTYDYEKKVTIGKLIKADLAVTNASGELYADDGLAEKVDMFASGSLTLETDDKTNEVHVAIHGATMGAGDEEGEVTDSDGDVAPRGGLAYYKVLIREGKRFYQAVFHPLVNAVLGNDSASTKGSSIAFGTSSTVFNIFRCNSGAWRIRKEFTDEDEAIAWCDKKLGLKPAGSAAVPDAALLLGKTAGEFSDNLAFVDDGENIKATGELKYMTQYTGFSKTADLQEGYFLPFQVSPNGAGEEESVGVTLHGAEITKNELTDKDNVFIVRLGKNEESAKKKSITVRVGEKTFALDYTGITYQQKG